MKVKKYLAATSREAFQLAKGELGGDAVILSNRQTKNGVEIIALANSDISTLISSPSAVLAKHKQKVETPTASTYTPVNHTFLPQAKIKPKAAPPVSEVLVQKIIAEIKAMRNTMEDQLATVAWGNFTQRSPTKTKILRALLSAGFSPLLSRRLVDKLPESADYVHGLKKAGAALAFNLRTVTSDKMIEDGGIYALIGPTGAGKTTTTAKLAARCVIRHGADKVALLTTDSYRIGGHEQLRIYGKLLGVPIRTIKDTGDLQLTLSELKNKHMVLIDTIGMSQRDHMVAEQVAMLCNCGADVKRLLLLNATSNGATLDEVISAYKNKGIHGCIITKTDEAASIGVVLDVVIRRKLMLYYVTNGQRVPEDIYSANARHLLHRIFKNTSSNSPFSLQDDEFALVMAGSGNPLQNYPTAHTGVTCG